MKLRIKIWKAVIAAVNAAAVGGAIVLSAAGSSLANGQGYDRTVQRWAPPDGKGWSQISCFLSEDAYFTTDSLNALRGSMLQALKDVSVTPEEGKTLIPDAYSAPVGKASIRSDTLGRAEAELTAVGGEFFLFRDFRLLDGAYFSDSDIMQDGAVIDRSLAWSLYGSINISGQSIYINGMKLYISGVVDTPQSKAEQKTAGESPRAYISYSAAAQLGFGSGPDDMYGSGQPKFRKITCYECIMPDPVEGFAFKSVKDYFGDAYKDSCSVVENSVRYDSGKRAKAFKKLPESVVRSNTVVYPFWENASRIVEYKLTVIYFFRRLLLIIPGLTALWLLFLGYRYLRRNKQRFREAAAARFRKIIHKLRTKKANIKDISD